MPTTIEIPTRQEAQTKMIQGTCSTGKGDEKKESVFETEFPASLRDAIGLYGEKEVWSTYAQALMVERQGEERRRLQAAEAGGEGRKRASWATELGL